MEDKYRKSGIDTLNNVPWGTHICQFYQTKGDLIDILVPYFKAGLENNEFCMWVTSEPLGVKEAKASLRKAVRDLDDYISKGQIEILDYSKWYTKSGKFNADEVLQGWVEKEREALEKGFSGLRLTGNTFWLGAEDWVAFREYEAIVDSIIGEHRMIAICTYSLDRCGASEVLDVLNTHEITIIKRKGVWRTVESDERKRLRKVLSASEIRFRRLFETAQDGILILDANTGQIMEVNPFLKDMLGYTAEELLGKRLWEIGLFKDIAKSEDAFKELQREGYIRYEDLQLETKDGKPVDVEFISNIYDIDRKKIIQCNIRDISKRKEVEEVSEQYKELLEKLVKQRTSELAESNRELLQDITERKKAEEILRENEGKWRSLVENAPDIIMLIDRDRKIQFINHFVAGLDAKDIIRRSIYDYIQPEHHHITEETIDRVFKTGEPAYYEIKGTGPDGRISWYGTRTGAIKSDGEVVGVIQITSDITEQMQAEEQLRRAAEEWRATFDSVADFIFISDRDFRIMRVNKALADILKMKPEEVIGKVCYKMVHGIDKPIPNCPHLKTLETKKSATKDFFEPHLGIHLEVATSPIFNEKGEVVASVHVARNISERKRMEEQLIISDRLASIGELASGIAHELNNPLTSVIGFADLLIGKEVPNDIKDDLEVINTQARRAAEVVKNLLTFARKHPQEKHPVKINSLIKKVLELRAYEQKVSNIQVNTKFAPDLPEITADGFQLQQVFLNIIINAEHFMIEAHRRGTITITTERGDGIIRASFADDGPGIAPENLNRLFDPFFTTKEVGKGTGLGLSICHGIITEHGGKIYAESKAGEGAIFVVELPILTPDRGGAKDENS